MNKFEKYYTENLVSFPPRPRFRKFEFVLEDGYIRLKDDIRDVMTLRNHLIRFKPINVYYSVSEFYRPQTIRKKVKNMVSEEKMGYRQGWDFNRVIHKNIFLRGDYSLDMDEKDKGNIRKAFEILKEMGFVDFYFVESSRGFHIHVYDFWERMCPKTISMPADRENYYYMKKIYLSKILRNKGIDFDFKTTINTRGVIGLPNSMHKSGVIRFGNTDIEKVLSRW